jgi:thiamine pyrophosphate-dependent acetolactate synthase large subunit-like protein
MDFVPRSLATVEFLGPAIEWERYDSMKNLIKQYLDRGISRRHFLTGLGAFGISASAANSMANSLSPFLSPGQEAKADSTASSEMREVKGTGGALLVAQLKAAGVDHIFFNPASGHAPIYDALVDEPSIHLIKGLQEGACVAMADGYAKASGKIGVVIVAHIGLPSAITQMVNTWKDQIPLLVIVDATGRGAMGEDGPQEYEHGEEMTSPITKWHWTAQSADKIPEITRRAIKFATTPPCGPVFLAFPGDTLREEAKVAIIDQSKFDVSMRIRPDKGDIERVAQLILAAKNPVINVGDDLTWCHAQKETVQLAELLGLPVVGQAGSMGYWSKPFPTQHPLYIGPELAKLRYPGAVDLLVNLGSRSGEKATNEMKLISIRLDPINLARTAPAEVALVADLKLAITDLIAALQSAATAEQIKQIRDQRMATIREHTASMREFRQKVGQDFARDSVITMGQLGLALEDALDKDTCYVADVDSGKTMDSLMSFGGADKQYFATSPVVLGWGIPAAFGVKLAHPDLPVVSVVGDGSFLFSGPQPLWTFARYKAPVTLIVLNNRSYNNERNRIWNDGGREFETGRDMTCYLGDPDVDYAKAAAAFGVEGEIVIDPAKLRGALERAKRTTADGRPYLLDVHVEREGIGAASTWHPGYSVADLRTRKV